MDSELPGAHCRALTLTRRLVSWFVIGVFLVVSPLQANLDDNAALWALYEKRDFFVLRHALPTPRDGQAIRIAFLRAATDAAFGYHGMAAHEAKELLKRRLDPDLLSLTRRLLMREERAQGRYAAAFSAISPLESRGPGNGDDSDIRSAIALLRTLRDVPAQTVEGDSGFVQRGKSGRFPISINGHPLTIGFDTGANFSFLAASTAKFAGLDVKPVRLALGSSTGAASTARIATTNIAIGSTRIRDVVFLILPDAGLRMPDGFFMSGLLGTPVISALGSVTFRRDGAIRWTRDVSNKPANLAWDGNTVLAAIRYENSDLICGLDTGADNTVFYEPFYRRYSKRFSDPGRLKILKLGGVSGAKDIPSYRLPELEFTLADKTIHLIRASAMTRSIKDADDNYLYCNIGLDAFAPFGSYTIDLRNMRLDVGG